MLPGAISINPLNWKLDDTYAPAGENLGSLMPDPKTNKLELRDVGADAQVVPDRGVIVTNANVASYPEEVAETFSKLFGPNAFHEYDYSLYYNNIRDNVARRVAAYKASR